METNKCTNCGELLEACENCGKTGCVNCDDWVMDAEGCWICPDCAKAEAKEVPQLKCVKCGKEINGGFYNAPSGPHCSDCWEQRKREERPAAYLQFKGTPGPWRVDKYCGDAVLNATGGSIAELERYYGYDAFYANACLIAAAPELLDAAKKMITDISNAGVDQDWPEYDALKAAVEKALGNE